MFGTTEATAPSSAWSSSTSRNHDNQNAWASTRVFAVAANACASPVHPRRSSRCGQSVGTDRKFPRNDHTTLLWNRLSASWLQAKVDLAGRSLLMATAVADSTVPVVTTSAYRKPWKVKAGSRTWGPPLRT